MISRGAATTVLVEALLRRGLADDLAAAQQAIDRLAAVPTDPGYLMHELPLLRLNAMTARARGDEPGHRRFLARFRMRAQEAEFEASVTHLALSLRAPSGRLSRGVRRGVIGVTRQVSRGDRALDVPRWLVGVREIPPHPLSNHAVAETFRRAGDAAG